MTNKKKKYIKKKMFDKGAAWKTFIALIIFIFVIAVMSLFLTLIIPPLQNGFLTDTQTTYKDWGTEDDFGVKFLDSVYLILFVSLILLTPAVPTMLSNLWVYTKSLPKK